ncbi:hypothetical protein VC83_01030 [Pseudogymnoascus destructans]|uniref:Pathogen-related protein n=1 Tax=Pseudogymnoascus destructans TaxID=655981 RepID=A0A177AM01_9PEZI|nr:uncharacterized protein VC83_01030 [Pseudogymnoascus destructans]OAF62194.2 hypothetical protein VC83_01030 [Pseudogymnoascus destructans]
MTAVPTGDMANLLITLIPGRYMAKVSLENARFLEYIICSRSWLYAQTYISKLRLADPSLAKTKNHETASLPFLVENLVKNWEIEASFKPDISDWRTIDHSNYTFSVNGGPPQSAEHMLSVGTYNAIIAPNEFYSPEHADFASSHKTFKRMMPAFAWEVLEVYSGPPLVAFKWRHWGEMKRDYVSLNDKGEKVTVPAHGATIDIQGVTIARVNASMQIQSIETFFDPLEMFRQIAPNGIPGKTTVAPEGGAEACPFLAGKE